MKVNSQQRKKQNNLCGNLPVATLLTLLPLFFHIHSTSTPPSPFPFPSLDSPSILLAEASSLVITGRRHGIRWCAIYAIIHRPIDQSISRCGTIEQSKNHQGSIHNVSHGVGKILGPFDKLRSQHS